MGRIRVTAALIAIATIGMTCNAYAYIDPVTGSFVIQGLAAGFAGAMVAFRSLRQKLFAVVTGRGKRAQADISARHHDS